LGIQITRKEKAKVISQIGGKKSPKKFAQKGFLRED
jgi:hypothetical protein